MQVKPATRLCNVHKFEEKKKKKRNVSGHTIREGEQKGFRENFIFKHSHSSIS